MPLTICLLICLFIIQSTRCALPSNIQNAELDDVTTSWEKFPSLIDRLKEAVSRFRCPKGWKRLGGSCYYFSNATATSTYVNYTCNYLHSNYSNLMQVRNAVEFVYAAHVLTRNNLSSLMIEIEPNLLTGRKIVELLKKDPGLWNRIKQSLREMRMKYQKLKHQIVDRLSLSGLKILRRTKKIKEIPPEPEHYSEEDFDYFYNDHGEFNTTDPIPTAEIMTNTTSMVNIDEYEYDDLDSSDEVDPFEQIEDLRSICDDIHWNVLNETSNSTIFILTKYSILDKTMCSLSDVDPHTRYHYLCEYVLDFCFANILCGKHGQCVNTLTGFKCSCSFLYGGLFCEKISNHGRQIIISIAIIVILGILSIKFVHRKLWQLFEALLTDQCGKIREKLHLRKREANGKSSQTEERMNPDTDRTRPSFPPQRRQTIAEVVMDVFLSRTSNPLSSPVKRNLFRNIWVGLLSILFLSLLFIVTTLMYYFSYGYHIFNDEEQTSINDTIRLVTQCTYISDYQSGNVIFAPFACVFILLFSWSVKREDTCVDVCDGRPGIIPPIEPFRTGNRFTTATVFGILAFEVLKIFEDLLFSTGQPLQHGVLIELFIKIALVILIGLRYYPVLASLQLRNLVARFFAFIYILANIAYTIVREGSCMGFIPLSGQYTAIEEAKLRRELGTWFIIYGLIKNIPHFFFLSYIGAELCVRFAYDSIYVPLKKGKSIWSAPIVESDESEFAKYYVMKLFRRRDKRSFVNIPANFNPDRLIDHEHYAEQQAQANQSCLRRFIDYIYHSDDDFRFTNMAMCTYTVAVVFLYYLAGTFVFLYVTRTTGHVAFLKFYFETTFSVDLSVFSFQTEIILSAVATVILYATQLFIGIQNYKKHKLQLYKGIYVDIPAAIHFEPDYIASNSVHYSGFLVGYMAWGFVICFHFVLLIAIGIKVLSLQIRAFEVALTIIVPICVIYLLKLLAMKSAGKFLFIHEQEKKLDSQSRKTYAIFVYFSFFADCFLGAASCIIRLLKSTILNVIFMARLDWSFLGRPLEKFDLGFAAYISYLHMEVTYTNPVMLAFCYSLYEDIVRDRERRGEKSPYADECCIAASEFDNDNDDNGAPKPAPIRKPSTNLSSSSSGGRPRRIDNLDQSLEENHTPNGSKRISQIETETSLISNNLSGQQLNASNEGERRDTSAIVRAVGPAIPTRTDLISEDGSEDDGRFKSSSFIVVDQLVSKTKSPRQMDQQKNNHGGSNGKRSSKKKMPTDRKSKTSSEGTGDEDHRTKDHVTIEMTTISSQPIGDDDRKAKKKTSSNGTVSDLLQSSDRSKSSTSISHESGTSEGTNHSQNNKSKKPVDKNPYDIVSIEEKQPTNTATFYTPPSYNAATNPSEAYTLRTMSYCKAQSKTPPLINPGTHRLSTTRPRSHPNDEADHYWEIPNETAQSSVSNPSYSKIASANAPLSPTTGTSTGERKQDTDDTSAGTENEEDEEEEDQDQETNPLLRIPSDSSPIQSNPSQDAIDAEKARKAEELARIQRRKRLRFRWHFLYTLLRNYHLFDLRKDIQSRVTFLRSQRSIWLPEQQMTPGPVVVGIGEPTPSVPETAEISVRSLDEQNVPTPSPRPPPPARMISVAASSVNEYPTSPAERYVAIRAQMLYDPTNQPTTPTSVSAVSFTTTAISATPQPLRTQVATTLSNQSAGFAVVSADVTQRPSKFQPTLTPSQFQSTIASNQSTADYPMVESSVAHSPIYYSQTSHDQQMQVWRQKEIQKIQKKQRHGYVYGDTQQPTSPDRLAVTTILAPQSVSSQTTQQQPPPTPSTGQFIRPATQSPFVFTAIASQPQNLPTETKNPMSKPSNPPLPPTVPPPPPKRMDRLDEDSRETSDAESSTIITTALVHRREDT